MYSAGYDHGTRFIDHGRNMLLAAAILFVVAQVPPQKIMFAAVPLYVLGIALLIAVLVFGITKKGAQRWVNVGVVIQPSELLKIAMPLMLAWWFQRREGATRVSDFVVAFGLLALPTALILKQPDLGTALLVLASGLAVIFFAGLPWKLVLPPVVLGLVGIAVLVAMGDDWSQIKVRPKIMGGQPLKKCAQRTRQASQAGCTLAIGEQERAIAVANVHGPNAIHRIQPTPFFHMKTKLLQLALHGVDGGFEPALVHAWFRIRGWIRVRSRFRIRSAFRSMHAPLGNRQTEGDALGGRRIKHQAQRRGLHRSECGHAPALSIVRGT